MASLGNIRFACGDPWALPEFWAAALDYDLEEPPPEIIEAIEAEGGDLSHPLSLKLQTTLQPSSWTEVRTPTVRDAAHSKIEIGEMTLILKQNR